MRVMVLALLLANALFFMWSTWVAEPPVDIVPRQVGGETELTLLAELGNAPMEGSADVEAVVAATSDELADGSSVQDASDEAADSTAQSAALEPMLGSPGDADTEQPADGDVAQPAALEASGGETVADAGDVTEPEPEPSSQATPAPPVTVVAAESEAAAIEPEGTPAELIAASGEPANGIQVALADIPDRCASLGPFPDLREASRAASRLRGNGFEPRQRLAEENMWVGHWVYLPSYTSRDAAVAAVEELREAGVKDIYIEPRGDRENAVSLGLFSDRENAELYAGQVRQYDVRPQITDRYRVGSAYWLDIELPAGQTPDPAAYQRDEARKLRLEPRDCDATGVAERDEGD